MSQKNRFISFILVFALFFSMPAIAVTPQEPSAGKTISGTGDGRQTDLPAYSEYRNALLAQGKLQSNPGGEIVLEPEKIRYPEGQIVSLKKNIYDRPGTALEWTSDIGWIEWEMEIEETGFYQLSLEHIVHSDVNYFAKRSLLIDGQTLFSEALDIDFYKLFMDSGEPLINSAGDQVRPRQVEVKKWQTAMLEDSNGFYSEPFQVYLEKGRHTIRLNYVENDMYVGRLTLVPYREILDYAEVKETYQKEQYQNTGSEYDLTIQAEEKDSLKNSQTVRRENDADPTCVPFSSKARLLNVIGGARWNTGNQSITWSMEVKKSGLYKISLKHKQNLNNGLPVYRKIEIDGQVPFSELLSYKFSYSKDWNCETLSASNGEPFLFYLTEGTHTLKMTVKYGEMAEIIQSFNEDNQMLSKISLDITKLVGAVADPNYDYEFFTKIPTLEGDLKQLAQSLEQKYDRINQISGRSTSVASNLLTIKAQIEEMLENPFGIAKKISSISSAQTSLGTWYMDLQSQPLLLDYIQITSPDTEIITPKAGFFQKLFISLQSFLLSFFKDYDNINDFSGGESHSSVITVWVSRGTEWAELIKEMADEEFTPETGVKVRLNILPAGQLNAGSVNVLMLSMVSGTAPDVAMATDVTSPFEFAVRDAVYDLSRFADFEEVSERFLAETLVPFQYKQGVFGLPENIDFKALFYRTDIVEDLDIPIPQTRDELYRDVLPVLYQNGLQFYYPRDDSQFIYQYGADFYTADGKKSALDTPEAYMALKEETELYTNYGIPVQADFYSRFRTGVMPMGIGNFSTYIAVSVSAPELAGKWDIAPIPGRLMEDGMISRSAGNITLGADVILSQSAYPKEAWEFLKWWTDTETQIKFGREIEALIGPNARWNSANLEAFSAMPWDEEHLETINMMWKDAKEVPNVLGGYFTTRHLTNAWNRTIINGEPLRDVLEEAVEAINKEMNMKQEEYRVE